jgi:chromosome segregation ATPase
MSDTDKKILDVLTSLTKKVDNIEAGQQTMHREIAGLKQGQQALEAGQKAMQGEIAGLKQGQQAMQGEISDLKTGQQEIRATQQEQGKKLETLTLQVEVINANQQRAERQSQADHQEIMERLVKIADISGKDDKALEKRVDRIERHLNLQPAK